METESDVPASGQNNIRTLDHEKSIRVYTITHYLKMDFLKGMLLTVSGLWAQDTTEDTRRSLRGRRLSEEGGRSNIGDQALDPSRAEEGRPDPFGGTGEGANTDVDDPFRNDPRFYTCD